uniref:Uncharacterized protein n=1 Tax=Arundo donax TaxID=35708 RepID=A0A0A9HMX1_ARUDO
MESIHHYSSFLLSTLLGALLLVSSLARIWRT